MRARHWAVLVVLGAAGCLVPQYTLDSTSSSGGGSSGASSTAGNATGGSSTAGSASGGSATELSGAPSMAGEPSQACGDGQKMCNGACVDINDVRYGCTSTSCNMSQCPAPGTATLACEGGACVIGTCGMGTKKCDGKCVTVDDPTYGCGATSCDASNCPSPGAGTLVCNGAKCEIGTCSSDTKNCNSKCVPLDANNGCAEATRCTLCAANETCVGSPSKCTCTPDDVEACKGKACGPATNNCGKVVQCTDTCKAPDTCGGGGADKNTCGCTPNDPCVGLQCGPVTDSCGDKVQCPGTCDPGTICVNNKCLACAVDSDCPAPSNVCAHNYCQQNKCTISTAPVGTGCSGGGTCSTTLVGVCNRPAVSAGTVSIDATEVTRGQYLAFVQAANGPAQPAYCSWNTSYVPDGAWPPPLSDYDLPVSNIDWCDAYEYCKWAGRRLCGKVGGGSNALSDYASTSLSQWMHACSGASGYAYPYGNSFDANKCVGPLKSTSAQPVGSFMQCVGGYPGLYDMSGNVHEWEDSCSGTSGPNDTCRERGSSYVMTNDDASGVFMRCDVDLQNPRTLKDASLGFRCCGP